jgi:hypothetical protein
MQPTRHLRIQMSHRATSLLAATALSATLVAGPARALTIVDSFDASITGSANAAQIEATIAAASNRIASLYSNSVTVNILFQTSASTGLGMSDNAIFSSSYSVYRNQLALDSLAHPGNTTLATAVNHLGSGNSASASTVAATGTLFKVLGYSGVPSCFDSGGNFASSCGGAGGVGIYDGIISFNNSNIVNWGGTIGPSQYDGVSVAQHEIDEVLGGGGGGSFVGAGYGAGVFGALDLYRYSAPGVGSFSTAAPSAYFSVDGGITSIVGFNQNGSGDYGDFLSSCPPGHIQDAFGCPGHLAETFLGSRQDTMLQALGYDHAAPAPLPGAGLASLGLLAFARRLTRRNAQG